MKKKIKERIEYWKEHLLTSGWTSAESGRCCDKCEIRDEHFDGRADALKSVVGCRNPFQLVEVCQCHLKTRQAIQGRILQELLALLD